MPAYLDTAGFKNHSPMANAAVDELETVASGFLASQLESWSAWIDARLAKRYAVPFASPYPLAVRSWLARIVTPHAMMKRGVDPDDAQFAAIREDGLTALAEIREAADSNEGLFDLPLRSNTAASGVSRGGPLGYSESSPYVWTDRQRRTGREEDGNGEGSYG
jgi:hypothetical protein